MASQVAAAIPQSASANRIPELDGIRGIAILLVLISHFGAPRAPWLPLKHFMELGWYGVDVFFALSGFLITGILLDSREGPDYFKRFYLRRALRILPIYYAYLAIYLTAASIRGVGQSQISSLWYVFYLANWRDIALQPNLLLHFWSLCVEEQFYFVWPFVIRYVPIPRLKYICLTFAILGPVSRWLASPYGVPESVLDRGTLFHIAPLALGSLLALVTRRVPKVAFLRINWLRKWGKYSYGAYVWHPLVMFVTYWLVMHMPAGWAQMSVSMVLGISASYLVARLSWAVIEGPMARAKERLSAVATILHVDTVGT